MSSTHETIVATRTYILHDHCCANHKPSAAGPQFAGLSGVRARTRTEEMKLPKNWMASIVVRRKFAIGFLSATSLTSPLAGGAFAAYRLSFVWIIMPYFLLGGKGGIGQTPAPVDCTRLSTSRSLAIQLAQVWNSVLLIVCSFITVCESILETDIPSLSISHTTCSTSMGSTISTLWKVSLCIPIIYSTTF